MARKKVNTTRRRNWLLVVAGCLALTAFAIEYWQYSSDATIPSSPAPRELKIAAAPAASKDAAPAAPSTEVAAPAKAPVTKAPVAKAPATKAPVTKAPVTKAPASNPAPRVVVRREPPAATTVGRRENPVPPAAPVTTCMIIHDHSRGNFESDDPKATCVGQLTILENELRFEPREGGDRFAANWADVKDVGGNRFFGSGKGGFHIAVRIGGKYKNFNLAPESKEKAEAKLILDLLNSYTRPGDRTK
jgi:hypothetical protein